MRRTLVRSAYSRFMTRRSVTQPGVTSVLGSGTASVPSTRKKRIAPPSATVKPIG